MSKSPWVSFCISTYKRPALLEKQLLLLSKQKFQDFEVIISDNDPDGSAALTVTRINDKRILYFKNEVNLGMVKSFTKSIERARSLYIVMVTDDDPVEVEMLQDFYAYVNEHPGYAVYCACIRSNKSPGLVETYGPEDFSYQLLHPDLTSNLLWSSCILDRETALSIGGMPDYGSPHLADHVMLALCSRITGGVFINRMYSNITFHDSNFSKSNFELYYNGCKGFYEIMSQNMDSRYWLHNGKNVLLIHLKNWFIINSFNLRKYFSFTSPNPSAIKDIDYYSKKILDLPFMYPVRKLYYSKLFVFYLKYPFFLLRIIK